MKMAAVVHVIRDDLPLALSEFSEVRDTPEMIEKIKLRFPDHHLLVHDFRATIREGSQARVLAPHLGDTQVIVYSRWDRGPDLIEAQVTYPIVTAILAGNSRCTSKLHFQTSLSNVSGGR